METLAAAALLGVREVYRVVEHRRSRSRFGTNVNSARG